MRQLQLDMGLFADFCVFTCFYQFWHDVIIKFVFFEKATKFDEISILLLTNKFIFCVSRPILNFQ